jgi:hypothetical protein
MRTGLPASGTRKAPSDEILDSNPLARSWTCQPNSPDGSCGRVWSILALLATTCSSALYIVCSLERSVPFRISVFGASAPNLEGCRSTRTDPGPHCNPVAARTRRTLSTDTRLPSATADSWHCRSIVRKLITETQDSPRRRITRTCEKKHRARREIPRTPLLLRSCRT